MAGPLAVRTVASAEWVALRRGELEQNWERAHAGLGLVAVEPLPVKLAPEIVSVVPLAPYVIRVAFADGEVRDVDIEPLLDKNVFAPLRDPERFAEAHLDPNNGVPARPGGVDLDKEVIDGLDPSASTPCARISTPQPA